MIFIYTPSSRGEVSPYADVPTIDGVPMPVIAAGRQLVSRSRMTLFTFAVSSIKNDEWCWVYGTLVEPSYFSTKLQGRKLFVVLGI